MELLDGLISTGDIRKSHRGSFFRHQLCSGLPELHDARTPSLHAGEQEPEDQADDDKGQHESQQGHKPVGLGNLISELRHIGVGDRGNDFFTARCHVVELHLGAKIAKPGAQFHVHALLAINDGDRADLVVLEKLQTLLGAHRTETTRRQQRNTNHHDEGTHHNVGKWSLQQRFQGDFLLSHDGRLVPFSGPGVKLTG